ncbi:MAG: PhnD/SsuA/transferrin family substrate-binding protein [Hoeflea sp.]|uniref:PhnD/SsuA/transferrin family substrate-binding protein n=1 Tax=Hoeflea sp. TaxID=1940281 RepID=UPI003EF62C69
MHFPRLPVLAFVVLCAILTITESRAQSGGGNGAVQSPQTAHIGVLAYRGNKAALAEWRPLADYLTDSVEGWAFELVTVTLTSVHAEIAARRIDFLITNPGHYVALAAQHDLSAIATRERWAQLSQSHLSRFGTAIFVARDSPVASLNDLKGKKVAAVSPDAFGGFQMAWNELHKQGVDAFRDLASLRFLGFPQDEVIAAVSRNEVDAGIIRSGLLEILAAEGKINFDDFRVLNTQKYAGFPYDVSGPLHAEWPFAALPWAGKSLREQVLRALLDSQNAEVSGHYNLRDLWSAPLSYEGSRKLVGAYQKRLEPAATNAVPLSFSLMSLLAFAVLAVLTLAGAVIYSRRGGAARAKASGENGSGAAAEFQTYVDKMKSLTVREREILELICSGKQTRAIAKSLGISPKTVEFHRTNLLHKTEAGTMAHLVQIATRLGYDQGVSLG